MFLGGSEMVYDHSARYASHADPQHMILMWIGTFSTHPVANLLFGVCYGLCTYYYCCSMLYDPGYVPKLAGLTQQKAVIDELLSLRKFDDENFCIPCMVRRPVRSKHCKKCARCVAKHDQ